MIYEHHIQTEKHTICSKPFKTLTMWRDYSSLPFSLVSISLQTQTRPRSANVQLLKTYYGSHQVILYHRT